MGLLNKIRNEHGELLAREAATVVDVTVDDKPTESAAPCPSCHSPTFWRSAYGGPLRCAICEPWPSRAMVGERWTLYTRRDDSLMWVPALRPGERAKCYEATPATVAGDEVHSAVVEDEDGSWLVIWRDAARREQPHVEVEFGSLYEAARAAGGEE